MTIWVNTQPSYLDCSRNTKKKGLCFDVQSIALFLLALTGCKVLTLKFWHKISLSWLWLFYEGEGIKKSPAESSTGGFPVST